MASVPPVIPTNASSASTMAAVANEFLSLQLGDPGYPQIDQMKLQKLLFYAHAWFMALNGRKPLFDDDFEAWPWGPVVRDAYVQTKDYGRQAISSKLYELVPSEGRFEFATPEGVDEFLKPFVRNVWDTHKQYTGVQLSNSTHSEGEPWTVMKERYETLDSKPKIPNSLISEIFEAKLNGATANTAA